MKRKILKLAAKAVSCLPRGVFTHPDNFQVWEQRGVHITPAHFYFPVPILSELNGSIWKTPSEMPGINMDLDQQIILAADLSERFFSDYQLLGTGESHLEKSYAAGQTFGGCDGAMLYSMIRSKKPKRIIEIGSGTSTVLSAIAAEKNFLEDGTHCEITAIEPYPSDYLLNSVSEIIDIRREKVENTSMSLYESLEENDILFIDSSHTVKVGGDVVYEINEILPRLTAGVVIHIHDICFPNDYSEQAVKDEHKFWAEQYLLQAFLAFNSSFRVIWCFSYVQEKAPEIFSQFFSFYTPGNDHMGSFWMQKTQ